MFLTKIPSSRIVFRSVRHVQKFKVKIGRTAQLNNALPVQAGHQNHEVALDCSQKTADFSFKNNPKPVFLLPPVGASAIKAQQDGMQGQLDQRLVLAEDVAQNLGREDDRACTKHARAN